MAKERKSKTAKPSKFKLSRVGSAVEDAKHVPVALRAELTSAIERLAREGCRAADYALSGPPPWPHLCAVHFDGWRLVVAFPAADEVTIFKIARMMLAVTRTVRSPRSYAFPCRPSPARSCRAVTPTADRRSMRRLSTTFALPSRC